VRRFTLFFGWLVVVGLATALTWQIVSAADDRVSERPIAPLNVAAPALNAIDTTTTTTMASATTTASPETSTTSSAGTTTGSAPTNSTTTTSTAPQTTAAAAWQTRSVQTTGGTVNLRFRPGEVTYQSAAPAPGFQLEVDDPGPPEVRVEFESETQKVEVEASWEDEGLDVRVSTEEEGED
jgi:cytoskeletal protein RodZ